MLVGSPRTRALWMAVGAVVTVFFLVMGTVHVVSALAHEEHTESRSIAAEGIAALELHVANGSVRVDGSAGSSIDVTAHISQGLRQTGYSISREGTNLVVDATCPIFLTNFCSVDLEVSMPTDLPLVIRADQGSVTVTDVRASVDLESDHHDLRAERLGAAATLRSEHGDITASFSVPPDRVDADSDHGDIELVVPDGTEAYLVDLSTEHGSADTRVRTDPESPRFITASTQHGDVTVRYAGR